MKKVLCTTLPSNDLGLLTRTLPVARELAGMGHEVAYCNPAPAPAALIGEAGLENLPPKPWPMPSTFAPSTMEVWNLDHFWALIGYLDENFIRGSCEAMMALMTDYGADVVVDSWNISACLAARALGKPLVSIIQADMHPANRGFIWWKEPPPDVPSPVPALNKVLSDYGLPPVRRSEELHVGDLTLIAGIPETDPFPEKADVIHVGPILWQRPDAALPDWIGALSRERPLVWVYTGNPSYGPVAPWADSIVLLRSCVAALADEDVQVVLTTGHHDLPEDALASLPANFRYEPYLPGIAMAERSDLLMHHGGHGSSMTGPYTGTPAVIVPTYSERESNARRLAALGAAALVVPTQGASGEKDVSVEELRAKVRQVLSDPSFARNARRMAETIRTYGGASEAARLIDSFAKRV
ncbi:MAG: nucleotide disphospho-sugar-binding domain-containing protein [Dehalococcoidia bacterium]